MNDTNAPDSGSGFVSQNQSPDGSGRDPQNHPPDGDSRDPQNHPPDGGSSAWPTHICNCLNMRRASAAISKLYDERLAPSGLTIGKYSILRHLKSLGPITVSELAIKIKLDRTTLVRNLKPLEAALLVTDISPEHARNRMLQLTSEGIQKCDEAKALWDEAQEFIIQKIGKENLKELTLLLTMVENLRV
jgi:DNA-binding MarR family transcriptional regulator